MIRLCFVSMAVRPDFDFCARAITSRQRPIKRLVLTSLLLFSLSLFYHYLTTCDLFYFYPTLPLFLPRTATSSSRLPELHIHSVHRPRIIPSIMSTFADSNADAIRAEVAAETASNVATPGEGSVASTSGGISVNDGGKTSHSEMEKARLDLLLKNRPDAKELQVSREVGGGMNDGMEHV